MAKILIIDDDSISSQIYATKLTSENHEVELSFEGKDALLKIKNKYDLILLDIMIPQVDGRELLKVLKEGVNKNSIVLVHSNLLNEQTKNDCLKNGASEYLIKADYTPNKLIEKIGSYLK